MHNFPKKQFEEIKAKVESIESRFGQVIQYWEWFTEALKEVKPNSNSLQRLKRYAIKSGGIISTTKQISPLLDPQIHAQTDKSGGGGDCKVFSMYLVKLLSHMVPPIAAHIAGHAANASMVEIEAPIAELVVTERYTAPTAPAPIVERIAILFLPNLLPLLFSESLPQLIHIL